MPNKQTTFDEKETQFAIKDTAAITKIVLTEYLKNAPTKYQIVLQREGKIWRLNEKYIANQAKVNTLLETMYLVQVKEMVGEKAQKNIIRYIADNHIRVEVFLENGKRHIYFVGGNTPSGSGTMMMLDGAQSPYITEVAGFQGYLTPRYLPRLNEWRENLLFFAPPSFITEIKVTNSTSPDSTFRLIKINGKWQGEKGERCDTIALEYYLQEFKHKVFGSAFISEQYPGKRDSLLKTLPKYTIQITLANQKPVELKLYLKEEDPSHYFGIVNHHADLVLVQKRTINKFLVSRKKLFLPTA
ncbi:MAG: DUF4340 domain-containing protein [Bacteroidia bacterium]|nr:DUF4340 domain-containing protein [Bacteroidia bacterium]